MNRENSDSLQNRLDLGFARAFGGCAAGTVRAPGRVNLIGDHTDYNQGFVFPAAIDLETRISWRARGDNVINVTALDMNGARDTFSASDQPTKIGGWNDYVRGSLAALQAGGWVVGGADLAIAGTIPQGNGLSSSAALEVATIEALLAASGMRSSSALQIAQLAQVAENDFVGMNCGIMDQLAIAAGQAGKALLIDCRSLVVEPIALPRDTSVMIIESGVERGLVDGAYNERRRACEQAARDLGKSSLRDVSAECLATHRHSLDPLLYRRACHVIFENQRVLSFVAALRENAMAAAGRLMAESHASLRDSFEVSHPMVDQIVNLVQTELGSEGGARMTGGGFGGAVVALLPSASVQRVMAVVRSHYRTPQDAEPTMFAVRLSDGVSRIGRVSR